MKKQILSFSFKIIISFTLLYYVFSKYNIDLYKDSFSDFSMLIFAVLILTVLIQLFLNSVIQQKAFSIFNYNLNIKKIYTVNFIGSFLGAVLPSTIGKDIYLTYFFGKKFNSYSDIFSCILSIRILGFTMFLVLFVILTIIDGRKVFSVIFNDKFISFNESFIFLIIILTITVILIYFVVKIKWSSLYSKITKVAGNIKFIIFNGKQSLLIILFIVLWEITSIGGRFVLAKLLGVELDFMTIILIIIIVNFLLTLPLSFIGIGIREVSYISLFSLYNIEIQKAFALSNLDFLIYLTAIIIGAFLYIFIKKDKEKLSAQINKQ